MPADQEKYEKIASIIRDAGGKLVGRTRLQKIAYLLTAAGWEDSFHFEYHYYGPYSEDLAKAALEARALGEIREEEHKANGGTSYSIYEAEPGESVFSDRNQKSFIEKAAQANMIELELAATAAYLSHEGDKTPWETTERLKENKAMYLEEAKKLYSGLKTIAATLPNIA